MDSFNPFPSPPCGVRKKNIVIGGGVIGVLSAYELARAGHEVVLIEAAAPGNGSSSRSAACIRQQWTTSSTVRGMRYATEFYRRWSEIFGVDSPIRQNGYLFLKDWRADLEKCRELVEMQREAGLTEVELLLPSEIEGKFPYIELTGIKAATWCPTDGFLLPDVVYNSACEKIREFGAEVILNDPVIGAKLTKSGSFGPASSVTTLSGREIRGDIFVNAAGVWAPSVRNFFTNADYFGDRKILPIVARRRYLYFLNGFPEGQAGEFGLDNDSIPGMPMAITPNLCYCRPETGHKIMMGWLHHTNPELDLSFESQDKIEKDFGIQSENSFGRAIAKELIPYFPDFEGLRLSAATAGYYEDSPDHNPFIGRDPYVPNLIHVAGFSGHGLMMAPFAALIVAHLASKENVELRKIDLPAGFGMVDIGPFAIGRQFDHAEGLVI